MEKRGEEVGTPWKESAGRDVSPPTLRPVEANIYIFVFSFEHLNGFPNSPG